MKHQALRLLQHTQCSHTSGISGAYEIHRPYLPLWGRDVVSNGLSGSKNKFFEETNTLSK